VSNLRGRIYLAAAIALVTVFLIGCPPRVKISDIQRDPGRYAGKEISIGGRVSESFGALGAGVFQVDDGSGTMWVYSQGFGVPSNGAKVGVTGRLEQGFSFGGRNFATILKETQGRH